AEFFEALAAQENRHLQFWAGLAGIDPEKIRPGRFRFWAGLAGARLLGPVFTVRRLERNEQATIAKYEEILETGLLDSQSEDQLGRIIEEEREHERSIGEQFADQRVAYLGAAVLGLNDALVELTGALTGLVSSIADTRLIGFTGLIIGIAAALSMAASNFLSEGMSAEDDERVNPGKAAAITGGAYIVVVMALIFPFFVTTARTLALATSWIIALTVIAAFSYYSAVVQEVSYLRRFGQMVALGLGVAVITFSVGRVASSILGISV
ncbi:MAG: VIT1/CCC1 transporter family protein, partial [Actinomycetota bacterium]